MQHQHYRSHKAGHLSMAYIGQLVQLSGWVKSIRRYRKIAFIELRESSGFVQLVVSPSLITTLTIESSIQIKGLVQMRQSPHPRLHEYPTGEIEVQVQTLQILNKASALPFQEHEHPSDEEMLKHRALALRWKKHQNPLILRSKMIKAMRCVLEEKEFIEVETPVLVRNTPGGANPFLVSAGEENYYALAQSPQTWKQLLVCGGIERYYQLAHCFRNEGAKPERQPEFSQFEIEMAFTTASEVQEIMEECVVQGAKALGIELVAFPKLSYQVCLEEFGSDKPHLGNPLRLKSVTLEKGVEVQLPLPESVELKHLEIISNVWNHIQMKAPLSIQWIPFEQKTKVLRAKGPYGETHLWMGRVLKEVAEQCQWIEKGFFPLWVEAFPLFEKGEQGWEAVHHPFTRPKQVEGIETPLYKAQSEAFDLVLNGVEVGGGSMRIHEEALQKEVFKWLNLSEEHFESLLSMLAWGAPPHGGMALGVERLLSILIGAGSIREVMAFPKTVKGQCLLTKAPSKLET